MVFANLDEHEKHAFFGLLDEYFESRPHILSGGEGGVGMSREQATAVASAGANVFGRAMAANPRATSNAISAGFQRAGMAAPPTPVNASSHDDDEGDSQPRASVASIRAAFSASGLKPPVPGGGAPKPPPPAPPRRGPSSTTNEDDDDSQGPPPPPSRPPFNPRTSKPAGLVTEKKISDLSTSSGADFMRSVRNGSANKNKGTVTPPIPGALQPPKSEYGPPPMRRAPSSTSINSRANSNPSPPASVRSVSGGARKIPPVPKTPIHAEPEEEEEWGEVLYDYNSGESTDLVIEAGDRVLIVEHSSEEWWKGELNGKTGLFPSSYVRIL
ncbi:hypothetical protein EXIGLDRAFT_681655 [Exidia glandulosa HHB12029]|uniref:SH3 domain-containing protein n=1 Tax=Exidia glandulosa HHB12029 TaxID=1314781 RepID=A0A165DYM6_EXIGL|nr:hypothetical protein EXIGLDRAFT_681655 [Exidia glandulosa HHB12029]